MNLKMNKMIKFGYILLFTGLILTFIFWVTPIFDTNGKVGITVITLSISGGNSIALFVRGRQQWYYDHRT